jgi:perosamine synthetase
MIPHNLPTLGLEENIAASRVLTSNWIAQGPEVDAFENDLCDFFNLPRGHALAVSSGSAALYLALWVLDGKDKKIGMPVYACAALRNAVGLIGGQPSYFDCEKSSPNIDMAETQKSKIDILIAPSIFGIPVIIPTKRNFLVIEDLAQAFGAKVANKPLGLNGDIGICSFYATKMITTGGQGGAIISQDKSLIDKIRDYRQFDCRPDTKLRFNFQMTDIQAAIGRVQLKKLPLFLEQREQIFNVYCKSGLDMVGSVLTGKCFPVRYRAVMRCNKAVHLIRELKKNQISAIIPVEDWELLDSSDKYPIAAQFARNTVSLPIYPSLSSSEIKRVANIAREFI